jgi:hypothetical protein
VAVPEIAAVPFPLSANVTPLGKLPIVLLREGVGLPVVVTVNVPNVPAVKVVLAALVIIGGVPLTVSAAVLLLPE